MKHLQLSAEKNMALIKNLEPKYRTRIGFSTQEGFYLVNFDDILYLKASSNYTQVFLKSGKPILVSKTLKTIESKLPKREFKRCHHSFLVNIDEVTQINGSLILSNGDTVPISRRKRQDFKNWYLGKVNFI